MNRLVLLLTVARCLPVPGLGLLLLPAAATPQLAAWPLHTALAVRLRLPDGRTYAATATVEELVAAAAPQRALLLTDSQQPTPPPTGTTVWARAETAAHPYAGEV